MPTEGFAIGLVVPRLVCNRLANRAGSPSTGLQLRSLRSAVTGLYFTNESLHGGVIYSCLMSVSGDDYPKQNDSALAHGRHHCVGPCLSRTQAIGNSHENRCCRCQLLLWLFVQCHKFDTSCAPWSVRHANASQATCKASWRYRQW